MLLLVHLQFSREGCLDGRLKLFNLLRVVLLIVKYLPFLDSPFVHVDFSCLDILGTELLNHFLKFHCDVSAMSISIQTAPFPLIVEQLFSVVFLIKSSLISSCLLT